MTLTELFEKLEDEKYSAIVNGFDIDYDDEQNSEKYAKCIIEVGIKYLKNNRFNNYDLESIIYDASKDEYCALKDDGWTESVDFYMMATEDEQSLKSLLLAKELYPWLGNFEDTNLLIEKISKEMLIEEGLTIHSDTEGEEAIGEGANYPRGNASGIAISQREVFDLVKKALFSGKQEEGVHNSHHEELDDITKAAEDFFNIGLASIQEKGIKDVECFAYEYVASDEQDFLYAVTKNDKKIDLEFEMIEGDDNKEMALEISELVYEFDAKDRKKMALLIENESRKYFKGEESLFVPCDVKKEDEDDSFIDDFYKKFEDIVK